MYHLKSTWGNTSLFANYPLTLLRQEQPQFLIQPLKISLASILTDLQMQSKAINFTNQTIFLCFTAVFLLLWLNMAEKSKYMWF